MASGGSTGFTKAVAEEAGAAEQLNQLIEAWEGGTDRGVPLDLTEVEHATKYALDVRNKETDSSLIARYRNAANEVVLLIVKAAVTIGKAVTFSDTATFQAAVIMPGDWISADATGWDMMEDGFLAASGTAQAKMADGFLSADETGRAKMAAAFLGANATGMAKMEDGFLAASEAGMAKMADSFLAANATGRAKVEDGFLTAAKVAADVATQAELDAHAAATTGIHGATATATANKLLIRDAAGRGKVVAPSAASDIALKSNVDAVQGNLNTHKTSTDHDGRYFTETEQDARFAPIAKGVTGGDSHDHAGGDGAQIPTTGIVNDAITAVKISNYAVTEDKIGPQAVTAGKLGNLAVTTGKVANDCVDDTKAGDRVPQFYRRQGGSATDWNTLGTTNRTPTAVRMQGGSIGLTIAVGNSIGEWATLTFPVAFSYKPLIFAQPEQLIALYAVQVQSLSASSVQLRLVIPGTAVGTDTYAVHWLAIGPE